MLKSSCLQLDITSNSPTHVASLSTSPLGLSFLDSQMRQMTEPPWVL